MSRRDAGDERTFAALWRMAGCRIFYSPKYWLIALIRVYQVLISPCLGKCCRFTPSCSSYAITALEELGVVRGIVLTAWRLLRCNPFFRGGDDPVPEIFWKRQRKSRCRTVEVRKR